jgi:DNA-directed RNA polymerase subunit D
MDLEILEQDEHNLSFIIKGISNEMANAIRRIMMSEVPVMAIDETIFLKNDSPLYDEVVSHRLGMIPLKTDLETYNLPEECECGGFGCPLCQISLTCEVENTSKEPLVVYSGDLKSDDPNVVPVDPYIPILKIDKDSKLILEAYAILGKAKDHVKWQAVSNIFYRFYPQIDFDDKKCKECSDKCIAARMCPKSLFKFSDGKAPILEKDYWKTCSLCKSCEDSCPQDAISVGWKDDTYIFFLESDGVLPFDLLLRKTFEIFQEKIEEFIMKLEQVEIKE